MWNVELCSHKSSSVFKPSHLGVVTRRALCSPPEGPFGRGMNYWPFSHLSRPSWGLRPHGLRAPRPSRSHAVPTATWTPSSRPSLGGDTLLIENIGETIDPVLDPLLGRNTIKKGKVSDRCPL